MLPIIYKLAYTKLWPINGSSSCRIWGHVHVVIVIIHIASHCILIEVVSIATGTRGGGVDGSLQGVSVDNNGTKEFVIFCATTVQLEEEDHQWNEHADNCFEERAKEGSVKRERFHVLNNFTTKIISLMESDTAYS